jgi:hypothetical protein
MAAAAEKAVGVRMPPPPQFTALMKRYNQLGRLLPKGDEITCAIAFEDVATRAEVTLILDEMDRVKAQIDAMIAAARRGEDDG